MSHFCHNSNICITTDATREKSHKKKTFCCAIDIYRISVHVARNFNFFTFVNRCCHLIHSISSIKSQFAFSLNNRISQIMPCIWLPHLLCSNPVQIIDFTLIVYHRCRFETKAAAARQPKKKTTWSSSPSSDDIFLFTRQKFAHAPHAICQKSFANTTSSAMLKIVRRWLAG